MGLNTSTALYALKGIDINSVSKVSSEILNSAQKQAEPQVQAIDYSKFNRQTLGVDLYSPRTNTDLQRQIAITQSGLYNQSVNVAKLNSAAAANLYSAATVQRNVELTQSIAQGGLIPPTNLAKSENGVQLFNISDKNSGSSNGFNPFKKGGNKSEKNQGEI